MPRSLLRFTRTILIILAFFWFTSPPINAQTPLVLPNTITTVAGGGSATVAGNPCSPGSPFIATDAAGDGCPGTQALFSSDLRGGVVVDQYGNVFINDTNNSQLKVVNGRSGVISIAVGSGNSSTCGTRVDAYGDGCPAIANGGGFNHPRGTGIDVYGNVLLAGYNGQTIHLLCYAASPLCSAAQLGFMLRVAGSSATSAAGGSSGSSGDGGTASYTGTISTSSSPLLNGPRNVAADRFGNVFIADTGNNRYRVVVGPASYNGVPNPWVASVLNLNPAYASVTAASAAAKIYPFVGGGVLPAVGTFCNGSSGAKALDAFGNGCPAYQTSFAAAVQGVGTDALGNVYLGDPNSLLRVVYTGGPQLAGLIVTENSANPNWINQATSLQVGSIYALAGGGATAPVATGMLGTTVALDSGMTKITVDRLGNVYVGDLNNAIYFLDATTGYIRPLFKPSALTTAGALCSPGSIATALNTIGDGCPADRASWGSGGGGLGVSLDNLGNLFITDTTSLRVRRIDASSLAPLTPTAAVGQYLAVHIPPVSAGVAATGLSAALVVANPEIALGTPACGAANADSTLDCSVPVTTTAAAPGVRSASLSLTATLPAGNGNTLLAPAAGVATGPAIAFDSPATTTTTLGSGIKATSLALDGAGALYTLDNTLGKFTRVSSDGTTVTYPAGALPVTANQIAIDTLGSIYAVGVGTPTITRLTPTGTGSYTSSSIAYVPAITPAQPQAIAVDANFNLYVADLANTSIYRISQAPDTTLATVATGFTNPVALTLDTYGNLYVADKGAQKVFKVAAPASLLAPAVPVAVTFTSAVTPVGVAVDPANNLYVQDAASNSVLLIPASGPQTTVLTGLVTPTGIAVDGNGNLYSADLNASSIQKVLRSATSFDFGSNISTILTGTVTNTGNLAATAIAQTDSSNFAVASGSPSGCNVAGPLPIGTACNIQATFTPTQTGTGPVSDAITLLPVASATGSITLHATKTGTSTTTTTAISNETPANPIYAPTGTEVTFTVAVTASTGTATGTVNVTVDANAPLPFTLVNGAVNVPLAYLSSGMHTILAAYPTQAGISGSTSASTAFNLAQASSSVTWTPSATTQQFGVAIGTGVLNPSSGGIPGAFVYSATPTAGAPIATDAASYLAIGTYSLAVTFTPTDAVDYSSSTASVASYTVTKANTSAAVSASTNVVAADGTGNFTTLTAAVATLPVTGGTIYIAPGTYPGQNTIAYPNVALRGLGGNPQAVILTAETGAVVNDQTSATLNIAKTTINSTSYSPTGFFAENLTVNNTFDTDATNANTVVYTGGNTCTSGNPPDNNADLFNQNKLCNSQALALWITADKAVLSNVRLNSLQDTLYAGSQGCTGSTCVPARQYFWKGYVSGDVDYIFGDAAAVFDQTSIFTAYHGSASGEATISAQNKHYQPGSPGDYLSGYVFNNTTLTSQATAGAMTQLYFGRPYGAFATHILLNATVDDVNPAAWIEFNPGSTTNLPTSTYAEFNTIGPGALGARETVSVQPTHLTAAQAARYAPLAFLGVAAPDVWDPTAALASGINGFVPAAANFTINQGTSLTLLARPRTPGGGATPTGTYTLADGATTIASGSLDSSGNAYLTTAALIAGSHNITFAYPGDPNFTASTSAVFVVIVVGSTSTTVSALPTSTTFGQSVSFSATVNPSSGAIPDGETVTFLDGATTLGMATTSSGVAVYTTSTLGAGAHSITANYPGDVSFTASASAALPFNVAQVSPAVSWTPAASAQLKGTAIGATVLNATSATPGSFAYAATLSAGAPAAITATTVLAAGAYTLTATFTPADTANYSSATASVSYLVKVQNVWAINDNGTLTQLDDGGNVASGPTSSGGLSSLPSAAAVDTNGTVWVANPIANSISAFSNTGAPLGGSAFIGGGLNEPVGLAIDGRGSVWIANSNATVSVLTNSGASITPSTGYQGGAMNAPSGIAIDTSGNVWIANAGSSTITEIIGGAAPVVSPIAAGVANSTLGVKP